MEALIQKYIENKKLAWSPRTILTERNRLSTFAPFITGEPNDLWAEIERRKLQRYSATTTWIRVTAFYQWAIDYGHISSPNPYKKWKQENARLFKYAYEPKLPTLSFEQARELIMSMPNPQARNHALFLLNGGLRASESMTFDNGKVVGKGNKPRLVFVDKAPITGFCTYFTLRRHLNKVGLNTHTLRKIMATRLVQEGMREADLMKAMGWTSITTAKAYLAPLQDEEMGNVFKQIQGRTAYANIEK